MITAKNLSKQFDGRWIFRGINLHVPAESSVVLVGPSGGGKSVLLKILAGLLDADEGTAQVADPDIGMLFQKNALFDSLTVEENLLFPLKERRGLTGAPAREIAARYLQAVSLSGNEDKYPDELSGGMQKRLGIARALIVEPKVIFYDEPTAGLDPITSKNIAELILQLKKERGSTLLIVTNDMQRAFQLGDPIYLIAQGELILAGSPGEARASRDPRVRQFLYGLKEGPLTSGIA